MLAALLIAAQVATGQTVATCRVPNDPQSRTWSLERTPPGSWRVVFTSKALDKPRVELPLPNASPVITDSSITLSFATANGGRAVQWHIVDGPSKLELRVSHGLEVNVEPDLDPAVDLMNTDGELVVVCDTVRSPAAGRVQASLLHDVVLPERLGESSSELTVAAGVARSVNLFQSTAGRSYAVQTIGWGRELTKPWGPGLLRGRFMWAFEAMPVFAQFSPTSIYGVGFAPVVWRWNFVPQPRWSAFAELSMGGMWSTEPIPERTSRGNFTAHWGGGLRLRPRGRHALLLAYRFQHFSNGNQLGSNPGVNAHVVLAGWSYRS